MNEKEMTESLEKAIVTTKEEKIKMTKWCKQWQQDLVNILDNYFDSNINKNKKNENI